MKKWVSEMIKQHANTAIEVNNVAKTNNYVMQIELLADYIHLLVSNAEY